MSFTSSTSLLSQTWEETHQEKGLHFSKSYYPLVEAAAIGGCTPNDLLHYGSTGTLGLAFVVPEGIEPYPVDVFTKLVGRVILFPEMLVLSAAHCRQIEGLGSTKQSEFPKGYVFDRRGVPSTFLPIYANPEFNKTKCAWQTFLKGKTEEIELMPERLFVMAHELSEFLRRNAKNNNKQFIGLTDRSEITVTAENLETERLVEEKSAIPDTADKQRFDLIDGPIQKAINQLKVATGKVRPADVFGQLKEMALRGEYPFTGEIGEKCLYYTNEKNKRDKFTKGALDQRLARLKKLLLKKQLQKAPLRHAN